MNNLLKMSRFFLFAFFSINLSFAFDHAHQKFDQILKTHVKIKDGQSTFNYKKLKGSDSSFSSYLKDLSKVSKSEYHQFTKDQQLAFLINAYNAFTIKLIIDHYPVKSIKDIGGFFKKPWSIKFFKLFGDDFTLDKVEHGTIRKKFKESRIHFAVNCASIGCPSIYKKAFIAEKLKEQLSEISKTFLTNPHKNKILLGSKKIYLSKIFKWYGGDFEKHNKSVKHFIAQTLNYTKDQTSHIISSDVSVTYLDYNWDLNE